MAFEWLILSVFFSCSNAAGIELLQCEPPDLPVRGSYGPKLTYYIPGDVINYYCDVDTYIGGNFYRKCLDTGDWTGDAPVCDTASTFKAISQSSAMDDGSAAKAAVDGIRTTCTETIGGEREEWSGNFTQKGELSRVMLFLPKGRANLEILIVKDNGVEVACARHTRNIDRYDWTVLTCPGPDNRGATGLKIRSLTNDPLKICEIQAYVLASPKCVDPHYRIENGRLRLTRKTATLVCDGGYTRSPDSKLECVREGEWNRKTLYCIAGLYNGTLFFGGDTWRNCWEKEIAYQGLTSERQWDVNDREPLNNDDEIQPNPDAEPTLGSRRERLRSRSRS